MVICDHNLHQDVQACIARILPAAECIRWARGNASDQEHLDARFKAGSWDVVFSVYSDYILRTEELSCIRIPLNIHPALPLLPGVGYDLLPMVRGHKTHGATLHWMEASLDSGVVIDVEAQSLPANIGYAELRKRNQNLVISLFDRWLRVLAASGIAGLGRHIRVPLERGNGWTGTYVSRADLRREIELFKNGRPESFDKFAISDVCFSDDLARRAQVKSDVGIGCQSSERMYRKTD